MELEKDYEIVDGRVRVNLSQFGRVVGVLPQTVRARIKRKVLKKDPDGKLDLEYGIERWYKYRHANLVRENKTKNVSHAEAKETLSKILSENNLILEKSSKPETKKEYEYAKMILLEAFKNNHKLKVRFILQALRLPV